DVCVELQVVDLLEAQQAIRIAAAERGQQRRPRRAFGPRRGDETVRGEMDDAVVGEIIALLDRGVGEGRAGDDRSAGWPDQRGGLAQLGGRASFVPFGQRPVAAGRAAAVKPTGRGGADDRATDGDIVAEADVLPRRSGGRGMPRVAEGACRNRSAY